MNKTINSISYNLTDSGGKGAPVLFLHYFGGSAHTWDAVIAALPNRRSVAVDLHGFGETPLQAAPYTLNQHTQDMLALAEDMQFDSWTLVGHSMGGKIALALAALQPSGLEHVVLLSPSTIKPPQKTPAQLREMHDTYGDRNAIEKMLRGLGPIPLPDETLQQAVAENLATDEQAWHQWVDEEVTSDISEQAALITVPVTILVGDGDTVFSPDDMLRDLTPYLTETTARVRVLPGAGHLLPYEQPEAVASAIRAADEDEREAL